MKWFVFLMIGFSSVGFTSDGLDAECRISKKYKTAVVAFFKNEARYLKEWIEYHRLIGIDHFYLYDNCSTDNSFAVLQPYINKGWVSAFVWQDHIPEYLMQQESMQILGPRVRAYEHAAKYAAAGETEWLMVIDVDDFLVPAEMQSVQSYLDANKECDAIYCDTVCFQARHYNEFMKPCLLLESNEWLEEDGLRGQNEKVFFRPEAYTTFAWPSYKREFKGGGIVKSATVSDLRIHKYRNRHLGELNTKPLRGSQDKTEWREISLQFITDLQKKLEHRG